METLPDEILSHHILHRLSRNDLVNLKNSGKDIFFRLTSDLLLPSLTIKVHERLSILFGDKLSFLYRFLETTQAAISGSVILEAILDADFHSDIDIIVPVGISGEHPMEDMRQFAREVLDDYDDNADKEDYATLGDVNYIKRRSRGCLKQQYISVDLIQTTLSTEKHIAAFDFSMVKNSYRIPAGQMSIGKLTIKDLPSIFNKMLLVERNTSSLPDRLMKYTCRGFRIGLDHVDNLSDIDIFELLIKANNHRSSYKIELELVKDINKYYFKSGEYQVLSCNNAGPCNSLRFPREHYHLIKTNPGKKYYPGRPYLSGKITTLVIETKPPDIYDPLVIFRRPQGDDESICGVDSADVVGSEDDFPPSYQCSDTSEEVNYDDDF